MTTAHGKKATLEPLMKFRLMTLVEREFITRKLTDTKFAEWAAGELSCPSINANHVMGCRQALNITLERTAKVEISLEAFIALEKRMTALEARTRVLEAREEARVAFAAFTRAQDTPLAATQRVHASGTSVGRADGEG